MKICNYKAIDNIPRNSGCTLSSIEIDQNKRATAMGGLTKTYAASKCKGNVYGKC